MGKGSVGPLAQVVSQLLSPSPLYHLAAVYLLAELFRIIHNSFPYTQMGIKIPNILDGLGSEEDRRSRI